MEAVEALLERGADPNLQNDLCVTALAQAVAHGHFAVVQALLLGGADPNATDLAGLSPLHHAVAGGKPEMVIALLEFSADPNAKTLAREMLPVHGTTALMKAATEGHTRIVRALLRSGRRSASPGQPEGHGIGVGRGLRATRFGAGTA